MRIAVMIMTTASEPYSANLEAAKATFVRAAYEGMASGALSNEYEFYMYWGAADGSDIRPAAADAREWESICAYVACPCGEMVSRTFEKTSYASSVVAEGGYDMVVKLNGSAYLNIALLDALAPKLDAGRVYCNRINSIVSDSSFRYLNDVYPRGDFAVYGGGVFAGMAERGAKMAEDFAADDMLLDVPHTDDVLMGICLLESLGTGYWRRYGQVRYNFVPEWDLSGGLSSAVRPDALCTRLKTIPPGVGYSGYSWKPNAYRLAEPEKFRLVHESIAASGFDFPSATPESVANGDWTNTFVVGVSRADRDRVAEVLSAAGK